MLDENYSLKIILAYLTQASELIVKSKCRYWRSGASKSQEKCPTKIIEWIYERIAVECLVVTYVIALYSTGIKHLSEQIISQFNKYTCGTNAQSITRYIITVTS